MARSHLLSVLGKRRLLAVLITVTLIVALVVLRYSSMTPSPAEGSLVVDVIIPSLAVSQQGGGMINRNLNVTAGTNTTLEVDVYSTGSVTVFFEFHAYYLGSSSGTESTFSSFFQPSSLKMTSDTKGVAVMTLSVPKNARPGAYNAIISAVDQSNATNVWGAFFTIEVNP